MDKYHFASLDDMYASIGFGGISVFLQAVTFLKDAKVNLKFYFFQKITHGILSAGLTFLICLVLKVWFLKNNMIVFTKKKTAI